MHIFDLTREQCMTLYSQVLKDNDAETMRRLCKEDLFFLLIIACKRFDINKQWLFERCREVQKNPDGNLDLWAREHFKSSIITFGLTLQDILNNPEITVGIFSHTSPIAKSFLSQIKREFETNEFLKGLFPDILYADPQKDSPCWSIDKGIIVKRKSNPKESTVEAHGLVDGQPTSRHFNLMVYDDVVTRESVYTPDMIAKVTEAFSLSMNLAGANCKKRYIGTRYHQNDTYQTIMDRGTAIPRIYPATKDGTVNGEPVLMDRKTLDEKYRDMGNYVFASQMLLDPISDKAMGFKTEWLSFYNEIRKGKINIYILVDAASEKKSDSDYTSMIVVGLAEDNNYYILDAIRDRLNLTERTVKLFELVRKWKPVSVGYEKYGLMSDVEHVRYVQEQESYRFNIVELGGSMPKNDRIRRLVPLFENRRIYLKNTIMFVDHEMKVRDFVSEFIRDEYNSFPVCKHDDMLDCLARIVDDGMMVKFPKLSQEPQLFVPVSSEKFDPLCLPAGVL